MITEKKIPKSRLQINREWRERNPWFSSLRAARERCNRPKNIRFAEYGGRGIKCFLTLFDVRKLWDRDGAADMKKPSLDRTNREGNYEYDNCTFMELSENVAKANRERALRWKAIPVFSPEEINGISFA